MNKVSIILWIIVILYAILPDFFPGPIDDTILILARTILQARFGI